MLVMVLETGGQMTVFEKVIPKRYQTRFSVAFTNQAGESEISNAMISLNGIPIGTLRDRNKAVRCALVIQALMEQEVRPLSLVLWDCADNGYWRSKALGL